MSRPEKTTIKLKDGSEIDIDDLLREISKFKQMKTSNNAIAKVLGLSSGKQVEYYWKKSREQSYEARANIPSGLVKGEILELFETLRRESFSMLAFVNKKSQPGLFVNVLKTVKDMVVEEVKFMKDMGILKPEEDKIKGILHRAENMSSNELLSELSKIKEEIEEIHSNNQGMEFDDGEEEEEDKLIRESGPKVIENAINLEMIKELGGEFEEEETLDGSTPKVEDSKTQEQVIVDVINNEKSAEELNKNDA